MTELKMWLRREANPEEKHVMNVLGHKRIQNTMKYTHLINVQQDQYVSRVARTTVEACQLVDAGFEYVCEVEGNKVFRKRK